MGTFHPNCATPPDQIGLVASPNIRSTFAITWTCLSVVLLCTWTVLHPPVPIETTGEDLGLKQIPIEDNRQQRTVGRKIYKITRFTWYLLTLFAREVIATVQQSNKRVPDLNKKWQVGRKIYLTTRRTWYLLVALFAPEVVTAEGVMNLLFALDNKKQAKNVKWTLSHAFFANMGGFAIDFKNAKPKSLNATSANSEPISRETPRTRTGVQGSQPSPGAEAASRRPRGAGTLPDEVASEAPCPDISQPIHTLYFECHPQSEKQNDKDIEKGSQPLAGIVANQWLMEKRHEKLTLFQLSVVGETRWKPDHTNEALAKEAMEKLGSSSRWDPLNRQSNESYIGNVMALSGNIWILDGPQLLYALEKKIIEKLPEVPMAELEEKGKGDPVAKALALLQTTWFAIQLVLRAAERLPITQLEIATVAFVVCSSITYIATWAKPQNVSTRIYVDADCLPTADDIKQLAKLGPIGMWFQRGPARIGADVVHYWGEKEGEKKGSKALIIASVTMAIIFGAVHFTAWEFHFPTKHEQLSWRIACILLVGVPIPIGLLMYCVHCVLRPETKSMRRLGWTAVIVLEALYVLARLFIFVEVVRALWFLPSGAFAATVLWDIPHIG